jgi:serine/threonine protein kinase
VRAVIKFRHPGIIKVHVFLTDDLYCYLVMEHCPGDILLSNLGPLRRLHSKHRQSDLRDGREGVAHRDPKLENILFDAGSHIKIINFGFFRFVTPGELFAARGSA